MTANASELFNFFVQTVRQNLHCILCFSPVGEAIRTRLRKFPSLITCMTIDWFPAWPEDALHNVARSFLSEVQVDPENQDENTQIQVRTHSPFAPFQPMSRRRDPRARSAGTVPMRVRETVSIHPRITSRAFCRRHAFSIPKVSSCRMRPKLRTTF